MRPPAKGLFADAIAWFSMLFFIGLLCMIADSGNLSRFHQVMENRAETVGVVTGTDCAVNDSLYYSFSVGGSRYTGHYYGGCESRIGENVVVFYNSHCPATNLSGDPTSAWWNEITTIVVGNLMFSSLITAAFFLSKKRAIPFLNSKSL